MHFSWEEIKQSRHWCSLLIFTTDFFVHCGKESKERENNFITMIIDEETQNFSSSKQETNQMKFPSEYSFTIDTNSVEEIHSFVG